MAKYFCGISLNESKYSISIIDDNLNIIFMDKLELSRLSDLLKRKSITTISIDAPIIMYSKQIASIQNKAQENIRIKRRGFDNLLSTRGMLTYQDRFNVSCDVCQSMSSLYTLLNNLGFSVKKSAEAEKAIVEVYPGTSFMALGLSLANISLDESVRRKTDLLKSKGIRIKDYLKKNKKDADFEAGILMQAYTSYLYFTGECSSLGSPEEGIIAIPGKNAISRTKHQDSHKEGKAEQEMKQQPSNRPQVSEKAAQQSPARSKNIRVTTEYCGAQYLYTNVDGVIRINDLRPIKSYRPFTEIYELKCIKQVQIIMCTTDGLRKVKANLIPNLENDNIFKAADDEDKKKLDSFWGIHGDKRGYLIKFNRVDVIKA